MKKLITLVLSLLLIFVLFGCSSITADKSPLLRECNVKKVSVSSSPEGYDYSFGGKDAEAIVDYLSDLRLDSQFEENPDEYSGMTWVISLEYDDGDVSQIYHFGNMFIRANDGPWYKMTSDEAIRFDTLLDELGI